MKYLKIGVKPDTFFNINTTTSDHDHGGEEEQEGITCRSVLSDVPTDLNIQINNTKYLLHKFPLLLRCSIDMDMDTTAGVVKQQKQLQGIGEEGFELCAKFCYSISITISPRNLLVAISAADSLRMTESVSRGNLLSRLHSFLHSSILPSWKDPLATLHHHHHNFSSSTSSSCSCSCSCSCLPPPETNTTMTVRQQCIDAIVDKILTRPLTSVKWPYTYTRAGYRRREHRRAPKDWWTEDVSVLDVDLFRRVISAVESAKKLPPQLIGEALHVYACKHLIIPFFLLSSSPSNDAKQQQKQQQQRRVLDSIVSMIPWDDRRSVSCRFLLRLLGVANQLPGTSPSTKAELVRRSGRRLDEATAAELVLLRRHNNSSTKSYDVKTVGEVLDSFLNLMSTTQHDGRRQSPRGERWMMRVSKTLDSYLRVVARDPELPADKFVDLVQRLPGKARPVHDELYLAVDTYIKEHPGMSKAERKTLCRVIDCKKLSVAAQSHAVANDRMPLRTIVQLLFLEKEKNRTASRHRHAPLPATSGLEDTNAGAEAAAATDAAATKQAGVDPDKAGKIDSTEATMKGRQRLAARKPIEGKIDGKLEERREASSSKSRMK